ncbi:glycosyl transferase [Aetokthonos hydrillicola Thurmond2011]|uniref:Glycosyl transferase n=1 Tax=Aetokthonos hydrillicola Thurmond2011 TaxID=2712845 RepID=A0AAP5I4R8_9CYAN|nr:glycosyltransferase [Aetokthonos hydrillicola]MBO3457614.1 glycosyl transferase [Aetokthonos hydrillicola CCALA 1050]MBW4587892.1 glycosyl transferase [Aetokthonos hydrillicola CCALA 1050]MDR9894704.1 glycosyl transferase [Aetokthonos hydrillicola Thurmond2011]
MKQQERIKVFIGSGEASRLERKVLIHSLYKHTRRDLDIYVFNGTHNSIELNDEKPVLAPLSLRVKYRNITEFSFYRFIIPEVCNFQGKAIYVDSDMICLSDIGELFDTPVDDFDFLAKEDSYGKPEDKLWGLSVMLINCERCRFNVEKIVDDIEQGLYSYSDFSLMNPLFLSYHNYNIGEIDPQWNVFDYWDSHTKLIHYTNLYTQPWKAANHPYGDLWFEYFNETVASKRITQEDIDLSFFRSYVRRDLLEGNSPKNKRNNLVKKLVYSLKEPLKQAFDRN